MDQAENFAKATVADNNYDESATFAQCQREWFDQRVGISVPITVRI